MTSVTLLFLACLWRGRGPSGEETAREIDGDFSLLSLRITRADLYLFSCASGEIDEREGGEPDQFLRIVTLKKRKECDGGGEPCFLFFLFFYVLSCLFRFLSGKGK